jgi:hypothetical protein
MLELLRPCVYMGFSEQNDTRLGRTPMPPVLLDPLNDRHGFHLWSNHTPKYGMAGG